MLINGVGIFNIIYLLGQVFGLLFKYYLTNVTIHRTLFYERMAFCFLDYPTLKGQKYR